MAENVKPAPPAEGAAALSGDSTEKPTEPIAPQSTETADKGLEANTEKKEIEDVVSGTAGLAIDEKKVDDPMPIVAPQPPVGVESMPTEASQKASDAVPVTTTGPSTVPTVGDSGTAAGAAGAAPGIAMTETGAIAEAPVEAAAAAPADGNAAPGAWPQTAADHPLTKFYDTVDELVQHGQREGRRLAGAGLGAGEEVVTREHGGNRLGLDRGGGFVALLADGFQDGRGEIQFVKSH